MGGSDDGRLILWMGSVVRRRAKAAAPRDHGQRVRGDSVDATGAVSQWSPNASSAGLAVWTAGSCDERPKPEPNWVEALTHLPLLTADEVLGVEMPVWREWLRRPRLDEWWQSRRLQPNDFRAVTQPVLHITSALDGTQPGALYAWEGLWPTAHRPAVSTWCSDTGITWEPRRRCRNPHLGASISVRTA